MRSTIAVVLTVHNRRDKTEAMLRTLIEQPNSAFPLHFYITDDGSNDGSAEAVLAVTPNAKILPGDGSLFWAGGMRLALDAARQDGHALYLLVNDDVVFDRDMLDRMIAATDATPARPCIMVGSVRGEDGATSYGGFMRETGLGVRLARVEPDAHSSVPIATFNANCVLLDAAAVERLDGLDPIFTHALADIDLGLRARSAGIPVWLAPGHVGACALNTGTLIPAVPVGWRAFVRRVLSPKGLPSREWMLYNRRHAGASWPIPFLGAYVKLAARYALSRWKSLT
ncbi:glycosyltransferase family 2 protein [Sphingomonas psychrotolerans]|uniref:glycosyltransferase family 2 protein n=1 Tax=Sphingomonas psychrotolerans TaxID=1327635 RepID=UPI0013050DDD|nr:glycosyltransferase family 2 protein [Sphingomonas psychrotolerans]